MGGTGNVSVLPTCSPSASGEARRGRDATRRPGRREDAMCRARCVQHVALLRRPHARGCSGRAPPWPAGVTASPPSMSSPPTPTHPSPSPVDLRGALAPWPAASGHSCGAGSQAQAPARENPGPPACASRSLPGCWGCLLDGPVSGPFSGS